MYGARLGILRIDMDEAAMLSFILKTYFTVNFCKKCVVCSHPHIDARFKLGASLTNNDGTGRDKFSSEFFNA
jgi:hypothetical protein